MHSWQALGRVSIALVITLLSGHLTTVQAHRKLLPIQAVPVDIELLINGRPVALVGHGHSRHCPSAKLGQEYSVRLTNRTNRRLEAVLSIDGLSVINGKTANDQIRGYLLPPRGQVVIPGWRRGDHKVAAFTFTDRTASYAYKTGRPGKIGQIRLVAFEERDNFAKAVREQRGLEFRSSAEPVADLNRKRAESAAITPQSKGRPARRQIGTGYGRELDHQVEYVTFHRDTSRRHTLEIHYGSRDDVVIQPVYRDNFTPPPPGYRGHHPLKSNDR